MRKRGGRHADRFVGGAVIEEEGIAAHNCAAGEDNVLYFTSFSYASCGSKIASAVRASTWVPEASRSAAPRR